MEFLRRLVAALPSCPSPLPFAPLHNRGEWQQVGAETSLGFPRALSPGVSGRSAFTQRVEKGGRKW